MPKEPSSFQPGVGVGGAQEKLWRQGWQEAMLGTVR